MQNKNKSKLTLYAVMLVCLAPILAGYITYYYFTPSKKNNYGTLVQPQINISNKINFIPNIHNNFITPKSINDLKGKWILLYKHKAECNENCVKNLYKIRQIRLTQGKEAKRIVPLWLISSNEVIDKKIIDAYNTHPANVIFAYTDKNSDNFLNTINKDNSIYLIDPNQNLMMYYSDSKNPAGVIKDLTKLLKWSRIG